MDQLPYSPVDFGSAERRRLFCETHPQPVDEKKARSLYTITCWEFPRRGEPKVVEKVCGPPVHADSPPGPASVLAEHVAELLPTFRGSDLPAFFICFARKDGDFSNAVAILPTFEKVKEIGQVCRDEDVAFEYYLMIGEQMMKLGYHRLAKNVQEISHASIVEACRAHSRAHLNVDELPSGTYVHYLPMMAPMYFPVVYTPEWVNQGLSARLIGDANETGKLANESVSAFQRDIIEAGHNPCNANTLFRVNL